MSTILLDTNIVSYILKGDSRASLYEPFLLNNEAAISLMTVAELFQWANVRSWGERRTNEMERYLLQSYTILAVDILTSRLWGEIRAIGQRSGRPISPQDAWIAASAKRHGIKLITHNPSEFELVKGLQIISVME